MALFLATVKSKTQNICVYAIIMSLNVQLKLRSYYGDLGTVFQLIEVQKLGTSGPRFLVKIFIKRCVMKIYEMWI